MLNLTKNCIFVTTPETSIKHLTLRLSEVESNSITLLRALFELDNCTRISVKQIVLGLIRKSYAQFKAGSLVLPTHRTTEEVPAKVYTGKKGTGTRVANQYEQLSLNFDVTSEVYQTNHAAGDDMLVIFAMVKEMTLTGNKGSPVEYSMASVVRELIMIAGRELKNHDYFANKKDMPALP